MLKNILLVALAVGFVADADAAVSSRHKDFDLNLKGIVLRDGVTSDIHVKVFVNERVPCDCRTIIAIHGYGHSAAVFAPLAEALFAREPDVLPVCRVAAIDLPGHGGSSLPNGLVYGELTLDDYVTAIEGTLKKLPRKGIFAHTIMGHSQGGLLIQMLQQRLLDRGSSLAAEYGVVEAVLLASAPPAGLPWYPIDSGAVNTILATFLVPNDPELGMVIDIPAAAWPAIYFSNLAGAVASGTPDPATMAPWAYPEPFYASAQLVGYAPFSRANVEAGVLSPRRGTRTFFIAFKQDTMVPAMDCPAIYEHLSGDSQLRRFFVVPGEQSVHDMFISDPASLLDALVGKDVF